MRTTSTLLREQKGAILVVAVFMAAFLVGSLWYIIGIGDAIVYRERVQDGADATAYASAVYHARGMNVIVVLNLVMAALLAVLIGLKVLFAIATAAAVILGVICLIPLFGSWACGPAIASGNIAAQIGARLPAIQLRVDKLLTTLSSAQRVVAQVTPWVGSFQSVRQVSNYSPHVQRGLSFSVSMVPSGERPGLPVQDMPLEDLCARGAEMIVDIIPLPGFIKKVAGGLFTSLVSQFSDFFCGPDPNSVTFDTLDPEESCKESQSEHDKALKEWEEQRALAEQNEQPEPPGKPAEFDLEECKKSANDAQTDAGGTAGPPLNNVKSKTGKEVFADAVNGNDFFSVISIVQGNTALLYRDNDKGVSVATWQSAASGGGRAWGAGIGFARADFYYDQTAADGATDWDSYASDAMWHLNWRARLRRFRIPNIDLGGALVDQIAGGIGDGVTGGVEAGIGAIPERFKPEGLTEAAGTLGAVLGFEPVADTAGGIAGDTVGGAIGGVGSTINEGVNAPIGLINGEILH